MSGNPLTGPRQESWRWDLLTLDDELVDRLDGVKSARLTYSIFATIRGGGQLSWAGTTAPDWNRMRLQPWYTAEFPDGTSQSWPLGVFIPAAGPAKWSDGLCEAEVELYDKLLVLDRDKVEGTFTVDAGAIVTDTVAAIIEGAGETRYSIEDSAELLSSPMVWEPGTSKLRIVNDLLDAINYFALWADGHGVLRGQPYVAPADRGVAWDFADGPQSIYSPEFEHDRDEFDVPNKFVCVGRGDGETEGLIGSATNEDPDSPYSFQQRGGWITETATDVEATSQEVIDAIAQRRLTEATQVTSSLVVPHAILPDLDLNAAVTFRRRPAGLDLRAVVQATEISTTLGELQKTTIREVVS